MLRRLDEKDWSSSLWRKWIEMYVAVRNYYSRKVFLLVEEVD